MSMSLCHHAYLSLQSRTAYATPWKIRQALVFIARLSRFELVQLQLQCYHSSTPLLGWWFSVQLSTISMPSENSHSSPPESPTTSASTQPDAGASNQALLESDDAQTHGNDDVKSDKQPVPPANAPAESNLVTWDGPDDSANPKNWSVSFRWVLTGLCCLATTNVYVLKFFNARAASHILLDELVPLPHRPPRPLCNT